jgi:hypothetical protein
MTVYYKGRFHRSRNELIWNSFCRRRLSIARYKIFGSRFISGSDVIMSALYAVAAAAAMLLSGAAHSLTYYATQELARMSREITSKHFKNSKCLALVTDHNNDVTDHLHPMEIPVLQVSLPSETIKDSKIPTSGLHSARSEQPFSVPSEHRYQRMIIEEYRRLGCDAVWLL